MRKFQLAMLAATLQGKKVGAIVAYGNHLIQKMQGMFSTINNASLLPPI